MKFCLYRSLPYDLLFSRFARFARFCLLDISLLFLLQLPFVFSWPLAKNFIGILSQIPILNGVSSCSTAPIISCVFGSTFPAFFPARFVAAGLLFSRRFTNLHAAYVLSWPRGNISTSFSHRWLQGNFRPHFVVSALAGLQVIFPFESLISLLPQPVFFTVPCLFPPPFFVYSISSFSLAFSFFRSFFPFISLDFSICGDVGADFISFHFLRFIVGTVFFPYSLFACIYGDRDTDFIAFFFYFMFYC